MSKIYDRNKAIEYAKRWAYKRNPRYYNFDNIGGDCTSFVSQCLYAGSGIMNYKKYIGWYYINANNRSPSWTGVEFLYEFLIKNKGVGPSAIISNKNDIEVGDVIQLKFYNMSRFSHSLLVVDKQNQEIYVASHTDDSYYRYLNTYNYEDLRYLHINDKVKI